MNRPGVDGNEVGILVHNLRSAAPTLEQGTQ